MGSWPENGSWVIDPVFHVYDNLIETLEANGYVSSTTLFEFPYDWRNPNADTARLLKKKIADIKSACACSRVDIVAHSMGGLVARAYVESPSFGFDVRKLIFLGTPHLGTPSAYLTWEAGQVAPRIMDQLMKLYLTYQALRSGYLDLFHYVRDRVISIRDLLAAYDYLKIAGTENAMLSYPSGYPKNDLVWNFVQDRLSYYDSRSVAVTNIVGDNGSSTITKIRYTFPSSLEGSDLWKDGYPEGFDSPTGDHGLELGPGDGTVTEKGSSFGGYESIRLQSDHVSLPTIAEGNLFKLLTGEEPTTLVKKPLPSRLLFQRALSPADILVTFPDGRRVGRSFTEEKDVNEIPGVFYSGSGGGETFITIPDPVSGDYTVSARGADGAGGEYILASTVLTAASTAEASATVDIRPGEVENVTLRIADDAPTILTVADPPPVQDQNATDTAATSSAPEENAPTPVAVDDHPVLSTSISIPPQPAPRSSTRRYGGGDAPVSREVPEQIIAVDLPSEGSITIASSAPVILQPVRPKASQNQSMTASIEPAVEALEPENLLSKLWRLLVAFVSRIVGV